MADITFHKTHFEAADPAHISGCDGHVWVEFGGVTFFVSDRESADLLASALNLCADRARQKNAAEREAA